MPDTCGRRTALVGALIAACWLLIGATPNGSSGEGAPPPTRTASPIGPPPPPPPSTLAPSPTAAAKPIDDAATAAAAAAAAAAWECPNITGPGLECSCDFPHTLRCIGDRTALRTIAQHLRHSRPGAISLLDVTLSGITALPANFLEDVALHGLVVSTGELRQLSENAFTALARPLQALGLPNNLLDAVPSVALAKLRGLERLDLSHNQLRTLEASSFQALSNVSYLDLSYNLLSQLSPQAFAALPGLRSLKMHGNHLTTAALSALRGLRRLEELDLSANLLSGPLGQGLLPAMPRLRQLSLAENELKRVNQSALRGMKSLSSLSLSHNQIDVLEDHAFSQLSSLTRLDLAYNGIVDVSSASLAHLEQLRSLDLTHNFLRSLNGDLVVPLRKLEELRLDDNDISMVSSDLPVAKLRLKSLSLADNPLNCDCSLLEFAAWLANSSLGSEDRLSAVCATPPALENGVLAQVPPGSLLCGEPSPPVMTRLPLAAAQLTLHEFHFDESSGADLLWRVEPCTERYTCDTLIVYEALGDKEVQIVSHAIHCDSRLMRNPCSLPVSLPTSVRLQPGHRYRYCVVLMVPSAVYDELSLGLGCSDIIGLEDTLHLAPDGPPQQRQSRPQIAGLRVNASGDACLKVEVAVSARDRGGCQVDLDVFAAESGQVHRQRLNCSSGPATLSGLSPGRYRVCASVDDRSAPGAGPGPGHARCVEVQTFRRGGEPSSSSSPLLLLLLLAVVLCVLAALAFLVGRLFVRRTGKQRRLAPPSPPPPPQCFVPAQQLEVARKAHYIKLHATTKL
ncbi:leucine-rich repeats and immunoglobulin-like domains protein 1 isoform X1 [Phymastichus coffea]|uniref:leucine-rich repeats and immunoglobulin-like domains protein 1 isoform X1 n=1 Tax=Phymastichus coffea TaxID=108790 RepID=UPI00273C2FD8|nr:leucine-rich repeats and immunoglobulin-like domains protein 1 isoform X1 [Phymastichus coffea]